MIFFLRRLRLALSGRISVLVALLILPASTVWAQDQAALNTHLARLDRVIEGLEQQLKAARMLPDKDASDDQQVLIAPPPIDPPPVNIEPPVEPDLLSLAENTCQDTVDDLQGQYQSIQKSYQETNRKIITADERLAQIRTQVREAAFICDNRLLSSLDELIRDVERISLQEEMDQVVHINVCIEEQGKEVDRQMETANHMRLERLMRRQNQVREITGGSTDLWQEYENFLSKHRRLLEEAKGIREECSL